MDKRIIQKKVCLLGDFAVGKTSLVRRFVDGRFDDKYLSTIGVKISRRTVDMDSYTLNLLIWDLAGGDDFSQAGANYLRGAVAALVVCDLTRPETLASFQYYADQLQALDPNINLVFVGNKADLEAQRMLDADDLRAHSQMLGGVYLDTSAKTGFQVELAFRLMAERIRV